MTRGLGHTPAETTSLPTSNFKFVDRLFAAKSFARPDEGQSQTSVVEQVASKLSGRDAIAAYVARLVSAEGGQQAAGLQRPNRGRLGSGGATVPRSGNEDHPLPEQELSHEFALSGSSTVSRWALLHKIQKISRPKDPSERGPAVCGCGMPAIDAASVNIHLRINGTTGEMRPGVSGIYRCGSPWLCPTCSTKKAFDRSERVQAAAEATFKRGGRAALVVLTASHSLEMPLAEIKKLVAESSSAARKGRKWIKAIEDFGILGVIVGQEVTYSSINGWHYHQHLSVMVDGPNDSAHARAEAAGKWIATAYVAQVRARGGTVSDRYGWHVRVANDAQDASDYTAKGSMAWEVSGAFKTESKAITSYTPWDIATLAADGNAAMHDRWREYIQTMPGTRSCVVSAALAKKLDIVAGGDKDECSEQALHETDDVVGRVEAPAWRIWMRHGLASTFLARVVLGGEEGFESAVEATEQQVVPLEEEYQRLKAERSAKKQIKLRELDQIETQTAFAMAYASNRLRNLAERPDALRRIDRIIKEASQIFPKARKLNPLDLYKAAA